MLSQRDVAWEVRGSYETWCRMAAASSYHHYHYSKLRGEGYVYETRGERERQNFQSPFETKSIKCFHLQPLAVKYGRNKRGECTNLQNTGWISADRDTKATLTRTIPGFIFKSYTKDLSLPIFELVIQHHLNPVLSESSAVTMLWSWTNPKTGLFLLM